MRALVTGGAGFIGSHLVDALVADGGEVVVLDNLVSGRAENVSVSAEFVEGDIVDADLVTKLADGCEVVFHQAALGSVARSVARPLATDMVNVHGTLTVLDAAQRVGVRRVVLASSSSVYGGARSPGPSESSPASTREDVPLTPRSPYAVSKLTGEHYARVAWELGGLETVCLRYFNVFGPRQRHDSPYAAVIPLFMEAVSTGGSAQVHGDGRQSRDFTFVSDAVQANVRAAVAPVAAAAGQAFNVARGDPHTLLELLDILAGLAGTTISPVHVEARAGDIRHSHADIGSARAALGYEPQVSFADGLAATLAWFQDQQSPNVEAAL